MTKGIIGNTASLLVRMAQQGAIKVNGKHGKMCSGCAFKNGTEANRNDIVLSAADCVAGSPHPFYCHNDESKKCVGYLYAKEVE